MTDSSAAATAAAEAGLVAALLTAQPVSFGWAAGKASPQLAALSVTSKAALCRALHKRAVATSGSLTGPAAEADLLVVEDVLLNTRGCELTELKLRLDTMEDGWLLHDLQHLCGAICSLPPAPMLPNPGVAGAPAAGAAPEPRSRDRGARLLRHFRAEGIVALQTWHEARRAEHKARLEAAGFSAVDAARIAARGLLQPSWPVKVFCDFDDTMCSKLLDWSFPGSVVYPGVSAFLRAMRGEAPVTEARTASSTSSSSSSADTYAAEGKCEGKNDASVGGVAASEASTPSAAAAEEAAADASALDGKQSDSHDDGGIAEGSLHVRTRKRDRIRALFSGLFGGSTPSAPGASPSASGGATGGAGAAAAGPGPADAVPLDSDDAPIASHGLPATVSLEPGALAPSMLSLDGGGADGESGSSLPSPTATPGAAGSRASSPAPSSRSVGAGTAAGGAGASSAAGAQPAASPARRHCSDACLNSRIGHAGISGIVYISARPGLLKDKTRRATTALLGAPPQAILVGSFSKLLTNAGMAERKLENFASYRPLFPEFAVVWLGDSGQGDIEVARGMLAAYEADEREAAAAAAVPAASGSAAVASGAGAMPSADGAPSIRWWPPPKPLCFIHDLCTRDQKKFNDAAKRNDLARAGIHLFDSYVEAATIAFERGYMSESGLVHVVHAATADMRSTLFNSAAQRDGRVADFRTAVRRARDAMAAHDESKCWMST